VLDTPSSHFPQVARLLALLADPADVDISNREIGGRLGLDHKFVAGFLAALAAAAWAPPDPPMMNRGGWTGPQADSAMAFAWFVWDSGHEGPPELHRISWERAP
jgi:hypothetical protein